MVVPRAARSNVQQGSRRAQRIRHCWPRQGPRANGETHAIRHPGIEERGVECEGSGGRGSCERILHALELLVESDSRDAEHTCRL